MMMAFTQKVNELSFELKTEFGNWHCSRLKLIVLAVLGISSVRSLNMVKVSFGMRTKAKPSSSYRRLQRFISQMSWEGLEISRLIVRLSKLVGPYDILIDRTNWKFGKVDINFLVFSILGDGYAIPIRWVILPKRGNSAQYERVNLLKQVLQVVGQSNIRYVIDDREFIGEHWVKYLKDNDIGFVLRVKAGMIAYKKGKKTKLANLCKSNSRKSPKLKGLYTVGGNEVYVSGFRFRNDKHKLEWLILISSDCDSNPCDHYAKSWYIENMFKDMKSNGFELESTHVTDPRRLETLFGLLALAHAWMIRIGEWVKQKTPSLFRKTKNGKPRKSIFRTGLDQFTRTIKINDHIRMKQFLNSFVMYLILLLTNLS